MPIAVLPRQQQRQIQQPVLGPPAPVGAPTAAAPQQGVATGFPPRVGGSAGTSFTAAGSPAPNPYNLPDDLVGGQPQQQQFTGLLGQFEAARQQTNLSQEQRYASILGGGTPVGGQYAGPGYLDIARQTQAGYSGLEAGYGALAGAYTQRTQDILGQMGSMGQVQRQNLQGKFAQEEARLKQDLINRGLYSTTLYDSMRKSLQNQQQQQESQLEDVLTRQRVEYQKSLTGEELAARQAPLQAAERGTLASAETFGQPLGVMERRTDVGPSYEQVAGIAGAVGAGQAGIPPYLSALGTAPRTVSGIGVPSGVSQISTAPSVGGYAPQNIQNLSLSERMQLQGLAQGPVGGAPGAGGGTSVGGVRWGGPVAGSLPLGAPPYFGPGGGGGGGLGGLGGAMGGMGGAVGGAIGGAGGAIGGALGGMGGAGGAAGLSGEGAISQYGAALGGAGGTPVINPYAQPTDRQSLGAEPQPANWGNPEWVAWYKKFTQLPVTKGGGGHGLGAGGGGMPGLTPVPLGPTNP